jgi:hypothetical protein
MKGCRVSEAVNRREALAAGGSDCFGKPIEFGLLDEMLGRHAA